MLFEDIEIGIPSAFKASNFLNLFVSILFTWAPELTNKDNLSIPKTLAKIHSQLRKASATFFF